MKIQIIYLISFLILFTGCNNDDINFADITKERKDIVLSRSEEMLAEEINKKYKHYININGIPEDEYEEFVSLHKAYNGVGGNHHGDAKYQYCIEHLPVIPVETKLAYKKE